MRRRRKQKARNARNLLFLLASAALIAYAGFQAYDLFSNGIPSAADKETVIRELPVSPFPSPGGTVTLPASLQGEAPPLSSFRAVEESYGEEALTGFFLSGLRVDTAADYQGRAPGSDTVESACCKGSEDQPSFLTAIAAAGEALSAPVGREEK
ncbi:MAG: hypothetical protein U0411_10840 [Thermodesulfovibrionales bacterium]